MTSIDPSQVSCVIPYAGAENYLDEVVDSALAQQFSEVIIVNDGFPPDQLDRVNRAGIRLINLPRSIGCPNVRNLGIKSCSTPYVVMLDHDDVLCNGYLSNISAWVSQHNLRCAAATLRYIGESSKRIGVVVSRNANFFLPSGFLSEVRLLEEIGYFPDSYSDDLLLKRAIQKVTSLSTCPDAHVLYRIHPKAESSLNTKAWWALNNLLPEYEAGTYSLAEINAMARDYATEGRIPRGLEARFQDADFPVLRFTARSAYACWLNRDVSGLMKYGGGLIKHFPSLVRLARFKWAY